MLPCSGQPFVGAHPGSCHTHSPRELHLNHAPSAVLPALADFAPDAAAFGCIAAVTRADGLEKTAVRHVCMYPFAIKYIGDKYALIILCVVEVVLQFMVRELCPGSKFLLMV